MDNEEVIRWERRQGEGGGTATYCDDVHLVHILEELLPLDLNQMVSDGEAVHIGRYYLLTSEGYEKFVEAAEQQGKPEIIKALEEKKAFYWFRPASEPP